MDGLRSVGRSHRPTLVPLACTAAVLFLAGLASAYKHHLNTVYAATFHLSVPVWAAFALGPFLVSPVLLTLVLYAVYAHWDGSIPRPITLVISLPLTILLALLAGQVVGVLLWANAATTPLTVVLQPHELLTATIISVQAWTHLVTPVARASLFAVAAIACGVTRTRSTDAERNGSGSRYLRGLLPLTAAVLALDGVALDYAAHLIVPTPSSPPPTPLAAVVAFVLPPLVSPVCLLVVLAAFRSQRPADGPLLALLPGLSIAVTAGLVAGQSIGLAVWPNGLTAPLGILLAGSHRFRLLNPLAVDAWVHILRPFVANTLVATAAIGYVDLYTN